MFPLKGIREHVTSKLDAEIGILKKQRDTKLFISETQKDDDGHGEYLEEITLINIPSHNIWVFDNEFSDRKNNENKQKEKKSNTSEERHPVIGQSGAFSSAGKRVETTILYHNNNRLYLFMIEMKRTISPRKYRKEIVKKFEQSLSTLSIFISAHFDFPTFEQSTIFPVGICCYNYYQDTPHDDRDPKSQGGKFRKEYADGKREMILKVEPLSLNSMIMPVLLFENPTNPISKSFDLDFIEVINKIEKI
jgi:hypothetical protein